VLAVDGETINSSNNNSNHLLEIAPGERIDVEFIQQSKQISTIRDVTSEDSSKSISIPVKASENQTNNEAKHEPQDRGDAVDGTSFSSKELIFKQEPDTVDVSYEMKLDMGMNM